VDTLTGGAGADRFLFSVAPGAGNADKITDFVSGTDKIGLVASVFTGLAKGALAPAAFHAGTAAASVDDHVIYDSATGNLWWDADGTGVAAQQLIATLTPGAALVAGDLLVV
jgi:Ca2+-binding RTX toxin-like protein